jgi:hypothetical protein
MVGRPFEETLFSELDGLLLRGMCPDGWLDLEVADTRLTCLIHQSRPFLAGLAEPGRFTWVPLADVVLRARNMEGAVCSMYATDRVRVLLMAMHYRQRPALQASTRFVDLIHVLDVLAQDAHDAGVVLEREGTRTLMFLRQGFPARLYFGDDAKDPGGEDLTNRFLLYGFARGAPEGRVEVFDHLRIEPDPDAGRTFVELAREAKPPPPMQVRVLRNDQLELQRPFLPPSMVVGRDLTCELLLDDPSVSRRHARLSWKRGRFWVEDLGSANGTTVNGKRINRTNLDPGDRVGLGIYEAELSAPQAPASDLKSTMMVVPEDVTHTLYLTGEDQSVPVRTEITIGTGKRADLTARGFSVRAIHARIRIEGSGVHRLVCEGRASVVLNRKKVRNAYVKAGDELVVGRSKFQFLSVPELPSGAGHSPRA